MPLFVVLEKGAELDDDLKKKINKSIRERPPPRHVPNEILQVEDVPRTLNGKKLEKLALGGKEAADAAAAAIGIVGPMLTGPLSDRINRRYPASGRIWVTLFSLGLSPLIALWFSWVGFTLYANRFDTDDLVFRLAKLGATLAVAGCAAPPPAGPPSPPPRGHRVGPRRRRSPRARQETACTRGPYGCGSACPARRWARGHR